MPWLSQIVYALSVRRKTSGKVTSRSAPACCAATSPQLLGRISNDDRKLILHMTFQWARRKPKA